MKTNGKIYAVIDTIIPIKACVTMLFVSKCWYLRLLFGFHGKRKPRNS